LWDDLNHRFFTDFITFSERSPFNSLKESHDSVSTAVITAGIARQYFLENLALPGPEPLHLHIGTYPLPKEKIRTLAAKSETILVIEEGYPFIERFLRGLLPQRTKIRGRMDGAIPATGELSPDIVRQALGLPPRKSIAVPVTIPPRPPQFCRACPHTDSFTVIQAALAGHATPIVTSDIGCYTLAALPPFTLPDSTICMGASIAMARGAADRGAYPVIAVIGDSTFLHSGIPGLLDARTAGADMTVIILDNGVVAMTGGQETMVPSSHLEKIIEGLGIPPERISVLTADRAHSAENIAVMREAIAFHGLSVIIMRRECVVTIKRRNRNP
jgi:indolepyruvate ferredoxin oxidoreductase alpha subunit